MNILDFKPPTEFDIWNEILLEGSNGSKKIYINPLAYNWNRNWGKELAQELNRININLSDYESVKIYVNDDKNDIYELTNFLSSVRVGSNMGFTILTSYSHLGKRLNIESVMASWIIRNLGIACYYDTKESEPIELNYHVYKALCNKVNPNEVKSLYSEMMGKYTKESKRDWDSKRAIFLSKIINYSTFKGSEFVQKYNWQILKSKFYDNSDLKKHYISDELKYFVVNDGEMSIIFGYLDPNESTTIDEYVNTLIKNRESKNKYQIRLFTNKKIEKRHIDSLGDTISRVRFFKVSFRNSSVEEVDIDKISKPSTRNNRIVPDYESIIMGALQRGERDRYGL